MINQSRILLIIIFLTGFISAIAQTTIAFQGFEGTGADNWGFTPPTQNTTTPMTPVGAGAYGAGYAKSGTRSMRVGGGSPVCSNSTSSVNCVTGASSGGACTENLNGSVIEFASVNISCYTNVKVSVAFRTHATCSSGGPGLDTGESLFFESSLNGGAWTTLSTVAGFSDCIWTYATNPVSCNGNTPVANPFQYNVPAGTQTIAFRVRIQRNRTDEVFYVDDVTLTGNGISLSPISIQHINP